MTKINLLPWRDELREQRKKQFILICIGIAVLGIFTVVMAWLIASYKLNDQEQANKLISSRNQGLDQQLKSLDGLQNKRNTLIDRMKLINNLDSQRPVTVHLVDELVRITPEKMYLTKFVRTANTFTLEGFAEKPEVVAELLRRLNASSWYRNAFMKSYLAVDENKVKAESSLVPREEENYGSFIVTADLGALAETADTSVETTKTVAEVKK